MENKIDFRYFYPEVVQVIPTDDYKIYCYFHDGAIRCYDVKPLIKDGTVFEVLKDIEIFKSKITIINHTVAWDIEGNRDKEKCIDLDPLVLYKEPRVKDPLGENK